MKMHPFLLLSAASLVFAATAWAVGAGDWAGPAFVAALVLISLYFQSHRSLKVLTFTVWVLSALSVALLYPWAFLNWGGFDPQGLIVYLVQFVMFGMGASVSLDDFIRAAKMPKAVLVGMFLQYTVMPILGWAIATSLGLAPEVAAGVILMGSCSGGVASNVMAYLAKANVALSVTMTACSTMLAPLMTPLAMSLLAGRLVPVPFTDMMISIVKIVILPISAGLIANHLLQHRRRWLDTLLPGLSMAALCTGVAIANAHSRDKLLAVGLALVAAAVIHNVAGYVLGYAGARQLGLSVVNSRTVAFEVGMQNGGLAIALAIDVLHSSDAVLAPTLFGVFMTASGSALASWWRERPVEENSGT